MMRKPMRFQLLLRYLLRAGDVAAEPDMAVEVTRVHSDVLADPSDVFCKSHEAVAMAETIVAEKAQQAQQTLDALDAVFRATRSVVLAIVPATKLPDTLKAQRTETEVLHAIETLVSVVKSHAGAPWADELLGGRFGTLAPKAQIALAELDAARNTLAKARLERAEAYPPAYAGYMAFKRVVRDVLGPASRQYRKLHARRSAWQEIEAAGETAEAPAEESAPDSAVMAAGKAATVLAGGPPSVKVG